MYRAFEATDGEVGGFEFANGYHLVDEAVAVYREGVSVVGKSKLYGRHRGGPIVTMRTGAVGGPVVRCVEAVCAAIADAVDGDIGLYALLVETIAETIGCDECAMICVGVNGEGEFDGEGLAAGCGEREFVGCSEQCVALYAARGLAAGLCSCRPRVIGMDGSGESRGVALLDNPVGLVAMHPHEAQG